MSPNQYGLVIAALIFFAMLALAAVVVVVMLTRGERRMQRRLTGTDVPAEDFGDAGQRPLLQEIARQGRAIEQMVDTEGESARLLLQAGWRDSQSRMFYYAFQALVPLLLMGAVAFGWLFLEGKFFKPPLVYIVVFAALALSFLLPKRVLGSFAAKRRKRIQAEVPLFVHLLVLLYDAGLTTRQAFSNLVREGGGVLPELGTEVQIALRQLEAGGDTSDVLRKLGELMEVGDLTTILGVLRQVDRYGGEIREPLLDSLKVIEERRGLDMRENVNLMSGRMTVVMVAFFLPALMIFTAGPAFSAILKAMGSVVSK